MTDMDILIKEPAPQEDLIATLIGLQTEKDEVIPYENIKFHNRISNRFGIIFSDEKFAVLSVWVLNFLRLGYLRKTEKRREQLRNFSWPGMNNGKTIKTLYRLY